MENIKKGPIEYHGYIFHEDGTVISPTGKVMEPQIDKYGNRSILIIFPNKEKPDGLEKHRIYIARTLYNLFHDTILPNNIIIKYKDGDKGNCSIQNLIAVKKPGTSQKPVLSQEQVNEIKKLYSNKDKHFHSQWKKTENDYSIRDLAEKYNVSIYTIQRVLSGAFDRNF